MRQGILGFTLALVVFACGSPAHADLLTMYDQSFIVSARYSSYNNPLDTGLMLLPGDIVTILADEEDTWNLFNDYSDLSVYETNANGLTSMEPVGNNGVIFSAGLLVGKIGLSGSYFQIGTSWSFTSADTGNLYLLCWDKYVENDRYINNEGEIETFVRVQREAPVPEPTTLMLFGAGLAGLAGARRSWNK